jgi:beta-lactamase class A
MVLAVSRRAALVYGLLGPALVASAHDADPADALAALEQRHGGRLGVVIADTATGKTIARRADERFAMCSTFKLIAAALVLARVDKGEEDLARRIIFAQSDLVPYSPETSRHVGGPGMTMSEICAAAITLSDNTAGNLMLASFGGPAELTAFFRSIGDSVSRLDRIETALNEATPGDPRDTTTPAAMARNLQQLLLGNVLKPSSRGQLLTWLRANTTGGKRLRAGLPGSWLVGDKTGTGDHGAANVVAIIEPPGRAPLLVSGYYAEAEASDEARNAVWADVGRLIARL